VTGRNELPLYDIHFCSTSSIFSNAFCSKQHYLYQCFSTFV